LTPNVSIQHGPLTRWFDLLLLTDSWYIIYWQPPCNYVSIVMSGTRNLQLQLFFTHSALPACPQPLLVRSLQLVEVWPYTKEEEEYNFRMECDLTRCFCLIFSSLIVGTKTGYRLYSLNSVDKLENIYESGTNWFSVDFKWTKSINSFCLHVASAFVYSYVFAQSLKCSVIVGIIWYQSKSRDALWQCFSTFLLPRNPTQAWRSLICQSSYVCEDEATGCLQTHFPSRALRAEPSWGWQNRQRLPICRYVGWSIVDTTGEAVIDGRLVSATYQEHLSHGCSRKRQVYVSLIFLSWVFKELN